MTEDCEYILELSMYDVLKKTAEVLPKRISYDYFGHKVAYEEMLKQVDDLSLRFRKLGVKQGDRVALSTPNCPQAVLSVYALNRIGAISAMLHPLSSSNEMEFYVKDTGCKYVLSFGRHASKLPEKGFIEGYEGAILTTATDFMPLSKKCIAKALRKDAPDHVKIKDSILWNDMMRMNVDDVDTEMPVVSIDDPAVILYTGGTTGKNKGAIHTNRSMNASAYGVIVIMDKFRIDKTMLAEMPLFHGFGLCTTVHVSIASGYNFLLVPIFTPKSLAKAIVKKKTAGVCGVPILFDKVFTDEYMKNADLSFFEGLFCGGDIMDPIVKERIDRFLKDHGSKVNLSIGYGCTECITSVCVLPLGDNHDGIGLPISGVEMKILKDGSMDDAEDGEYGEICVSGDVLMKEYLNEPEETKEVLKVHPDGKVWLHTGDLGYRKDGYYYFVQRIKRMIITSGYNVYPSQVEMILDRHPEVKASCVIGIPDKNRGQAVKAFIVAKGGVDKEKLRKDLEMYMKENICSYAKPRSYEFVDSLPMTKLNKVDFRALEARENNCS